MEAEKERQKEQHLVHDLFAVAAVITKPAQTHTFSLSFSHIQTGIVTGAT